MLTSRWSAGCKTHLRDDHHPWSGCGVPTLNLWRLKMRYIVLWALGVPIGALVVLHLLGIL